MGTRFIKLTVLLLLAGLLLGTLHKFQWTLLVILLTICCCYLGKNWKANKRAKQFKLLGFCLTMIAGTCCELWGTYHRYWTYHDIPSWQLIPAWIPVAWGCTYLAFYLFETCFIKLSKDNRINLTAMLIATFILPTIGEYIPIYMNVWTYHWPYQLVGVPLLASPGIWWVHISVFLIMSKLNHHFQINDPVYNVSNDVIKPSRANTAVVDSTEPLSTPAYSCTLRAQPVDWRACFFDEY